MKAGFSAQDIEDLDPNPYLSRSYCSTQVRARARHRPFVRIGLVLWTLLSLCAGAQRLSANDKKDVESWIAIAEETFDHIEVGEQPWKKGELRKKREGGWFCAHSGSCEFGVTEENSPWSEGKRCLRIKQNAGEGQETTAKSQGSLRLSVQWEKPENVKAVRVSFDWKVDELGGGWHYTGTYFEADEGESAPAYLILRDYELASSENYLCAMGNSSKRVLCEEIKPNLWYHITIVHRPPFERYSVSILNNENKTIRTYDILPLCTGVGGMKVYPGSPPDLFVFGTWNYMVRGTIWIDNVKVEAVIPQNERPEL